MEHENTLDWERAVNEIIDLYRNVEKKIFFPTSILPHPFYRRGMEYNQVRIMSFPGYHSDNFTECSHFYTQRIPWEMALPFIFVAIYQIRDYMGVAR